MELQSGNNELIYHTGNSDDEDNIIITTTSTDTSPKSHKFSFNKSQLKFQELLYEILFESFSESHLIVKGRVTLSQNGTIQGLDQANLATLGGSLLPGVGNMFIGANIMISAIREGFRNINEANIKSNALKIYELATTYKAMHETSENLSCLVAYIYGEQINKLHEDSRKKFAEFVSGQMFHYIASDEGKNSSRLKSVTNQVIDNLGYLWNKFLRAVNLSYAPNNDPTHIGPEYKMLNGLIYFQNEGEPKIKLRAKDNQQNLTSPYYAESILVKSGIRTPDGKVYINADCDCLKYGYRILPDYYAKSLRFKLVSNNNKSSLSSFSSAELVRNSMSNSILSNVTLNNKKRKADVINDKKESDNNDNCFIS